MQEKATRAAYDEGWKVLLGEHLDAFLQFFFPHVYDAIDWSKAYKFLDNELHSITANVKEGVGLRRVDKLVQVYRKGGESIWLLIHIEIQGQKVVNFATRMYIYSYRIYDEYRVHPVSLAVFTDSNHDWRPDHYEHEDLGCKTQYDYPTAKLLEYDDDYLMQSTNPFALVAIAHRRVAKLGKSGEKRVQVKTELMNLLLTHGYSSEYIHSLTRFLDYIVKLPDQWVPLFLENMKALEKVHGDKMEYLTTWERIGLEKGKMMTLVETVIRQLTAKFGELPEQIDKKIREIEDEEILNDLIVQLLFASSLDEMGLVVENGDDTL